MKKQLENIDPTMQRLSSITDQCSKRIEFTEHKLTTIERHLPTMIQEIMDYYFEHRLEKQEQTDSVTKQYVKDALSRKLDRVYFDDHVKRMTRADDKPDITFELVDRLHMLETE